MSEARSAIYENEWFGAWQCDPVEPAWEKSNVVPDGDAATLLALAAEGGRQIVLEDNGDYEVSASVLVASNTEIRVKNGGTATIRPRLGDFPYGDDLIRIEEASQVLIDGVWLVPYAGTPGDEVMAHSGVAVRSSHHVMVHGTRTDAINGSPYRVEHSECVDIDDVYAMEVDFIPVVDVCKAKQNEAAAVNIVESNRVLVVGLEVDVTARAGVSVLDSSDIYVLRPDLLDMAVFCEGTAVAARLSPSVTSAQYNMVVQGIRHVTSDGHVVPANVNGGIGIFVDATAPGGNQSVLITENAIAMVGPSSPPIAIKLCGNLANSPDSEIIFNTTAPGDITTNLDLYTIGNNNAQGALERNVPCDVTNPWW